MTIRNVFLTWRIVCRFIFPGNVAAGVAIGVAGFAAGIGMVAFAEAQVRTKTEIWLDMRIQAFLYLTLF